MLSGDTSAHIDALDKVVKKQKLDPSIEKLDEVIAQLEQWDAAAAEDDEARAKSLLQLQERITACDSRACIQAHHKELVALSTKLSKIADKSELKTSIEDAVPTANELSSTLVNELIQQHLLITGNFDAAASLREESGAGATPEIETGLRELHAVVAALEDTETRPLLDWISRHRSGLGPRAARALELDVRDLEFAQRVLAGDIASARALLVESRAAVVAASAASSSSAEGASSSSTSTSTSTSGGSGGGGGGGGSSTADAVATHPRPPPAATAILGDPQLTRLAGALAFANRPLQSPYKDIFDTPKLRAALIERLSKEGMRLLHLPAAPPLSTCVDAANVALPKLAKLASVLKAKYTEAFTAGSTLPLDLDLGPQFAFHSTFTCPVSKELATPGNPPMLLPCGHVLALGSVTKLARGSRHSTFKCPYCPRESTTSTAQALSI